MRHTALVAGLALGLMSGTAKAAYILDIDQVAGNVVATGSGFIDLTGLTLNSTNRNDDTGIQPDLAEVIIGSGNDDAYGGISGPRNFGNGLDFISTTTTTGPKIGIFPIFGAIYLPHNYQSGDTLVNSATFADTTLAELGLTPGSYAYTVAAQGAEPIFTVNVGVSAVPLPASAPMFGAALLALGAVGYGVKRKKAAAAA